VLRHFKHLNGRSFVSVETSEDHVSGCFMIGCHSHDDDDDRDTPRWAVCLIVVEWWSGGTVVEGYCANDPSKPPIQPHHENVLGRENKGGDDDDCMEI